MKKPEHTFLCSITIPENRAVFKIMWKKYSRAREATDDDKIWRMLYSGRITEATNKQSEYVTIVFTCEKC